MLLIRYVVYFSVAVTAATWRGYVCSPSFHCFCSSPYHVLTSTATWWDMNYSVCYVRFRVVKAVKSRNCSFCFKNGIKIIVVCGSTGNVHILAFVLSGDCLYLNEYCTQFYVLKLNTYHPQICGYCALWDSVTEMVFEEDKLMFHLLNWRSWSLLLNRIDSRHTRIDKLYWKQFSLLIMQRQFWRW